MLSKLNSVKYFNIILSILYLFIIPAIFIASFALQPIQPLVLQSQIYSTLACFIMVVYIVEIARRKSLMHPYNFFIIGVFICWFGQSIILSLQPEILKQLTISEFKPNIYLHTLLYSIASFYILCGLGLYKIKNINHDNAHKKVVNLYKFKSVNIVGLAMAGIGASAYVGSKITQLTLANKYGYKAIYEMPLESNSSSSLLSALSMLFVPGIFMLLIANKNNKNLRRILSCALLLICLTSLYIGARGEVIGILIAYIWLYSAEINKIKINRLLVVPIFLIVAQTSNAIALFRASNERTFSMFINILLSPKSLLEPVRNIFIEYGFNIFSLYNTIDLVPLQKSYSYGYTYLASILAIFPRIMFAGYSFANDAALANWLKLKLNLNYGPGFTIVAESYYNFGFFGIVSILILGIFIINVFSNGKKNSDDKSIKNIFIAVAIYNFLFLARDTSLFVIRKYVYTIMIPTLAIYIVYKYINRNGNIENEK
jgi:hypothetical protein